MPSTRLTWDRVEFPLFFAPGRVDDATLGIVFDLLGPKDRDQHLADGIFLHDFVFSRVVSENSVLDAPVRRHREVVIGIVGDTHH